MSEQTVVHANVFSPFESFLFKSKANDRVRCTTILCSNADCPLLAIGQCAIRGGLFGGSCPYGRMRAESGPTKRASGCSDWVSERKQQYKGVGFLHRPEDKMQLIGEFVYLPYAHMTMIKSVPFRDRAGVFGKGDPFLPLVDWTVENVVSLVSSCPQALMGNYISSYTTEVVPKFLVHLREVDPVMWSQLIVQMPALDVAPNHVGRKAVLSTLNHPLAWTESVKDGYPVLWRWDGETLTTDSMNSYSATWGRVDVESVVIHAKPKPLATVIVQSNDWVNDKTQFTT